MNKKLEEYKTLLTEIQTKKEEEKKLQTKIKNLQKSLTRLVNKFIELKHELEEEGILQISEDQKRNNIKINKAIKKIKKP